MGGGTTEGTTGAGVAQGVLPAQVSLLLPESSLGFSSQLFTCTLTVTPEYSSAQRGEDRLTLQL